MRKLIFWHRFLSPHTFGLADALSRKGYDVTFIIEQKMLEQRKDMGWSMPALGNVEVVHIEGDKHIEKLAMQYPADAVHIVQGVRANGVLTKTRAVLQRNRARWGTVIESIDERSRIWPVKRLHYRLLLSMGISRPDFILAIGRVTPDWIVARGYPKKKTFPFSFFVSPSMLPDNAKRHGNPFSIVFAGILVERKRVDILIDALSLMSRRDFVLTIIGDGPLNEQLQSRAREKLGSGKFHFLGAKPIDEIPSLISEHDCLVLPSDHDGWGVVVTEALMACVPAICSDTCGAAEGVVNSGVGGIFAKGDVLGLSALLEDSVRQGPLNVDERIRLANWARCFSNETGAEYLVKILQSVYEEAKRPSPPWLQEQ